MEEPRKEEKNVVILNRGMDTSLAVNLQGATITSWRVMGVEQLFVGGLGKYSKFHPISGGISLAFPDYQSWFYGPRFGSARLVRWYQFIEPYCHSNGDVEAAFIVPSSAFTRSMSSQLWWLALWVVLCERELHVRYFVFNVEHHLPFYCAPMLMVSLLFSDVRDISVTGLQGTTYVIDRFGSDYYEEDQAELRVRDFIHQMYMDTPDLVISDPLSFRRITIIKDLPEVAVWNPWEGGPDEICCHDLTPENRDFNIDQHLRMVRFSFGRVEEPLLLHPNQHFVGRVILQVEDTRGTQDPCKPKRLVPKLTSQVPHLPDLGRKEKPRTRADGSIAPKAESSLTDVPYLVLEEMLSGVTGATRARGEPVDDPRMTAGSAIDAFVEKMRREQVSKSKTKLSI